jgi:hypothetical protein
LAAGVIVAVLSFNPLISTLNPVSIPGGSPLPARVKVLKAVRHEAQDAMP